LFILLQAQRRQ